MGNSVTREISFETLDNAHIAIDEKEIQSIETYDKKPTNVYEIYHKKGQKYTEFKLFPRPHRETLEYDETILVSRWWITEGDFYTEKDISENYIIVGNGVYTKPYISICYGDNKKLKIKFRSTESMLAYWEELKERFKDSNLRYMF